MRTWCRCDELPVFLGGYWLIHGVLEKRAFLLFRISVLRSDTGAPSLVDLGVLG